MSHLTGFTLHVVARLLRKFERSYSFTDLGPLYKVLRSEGASQVRIWLACQYGPYETAKLPTDEDSLAVLFWHFFYGFANLGCGEVGWEIWFSGQQYVKIACYGVFLMV